VLGSTGFVGRAVGDALERAGFDVTRHSRTTGSAPTTIDLTSERASDKVRAIALGCELCVSCVGAIGFDDARVEDANGEANARAAEGCRQANVKKFVYVSVSSEVRDVASKASMMKGYFEGKTRAEEAIRANFASDDAFVVKPSFIYGGSSFSLNPPRVTKAYGEVLSKVLGSTVVKGVAKSAPGVVKVVLAEPASVDDVAMAIVGFALGKRGGGTCDGTDEIKASAALARE